MTNDYVCDLRHEKENKEKNVESERIEQLINS
jgi:hypothetical protein